MGDVFSRSITLFAQEISGVPEELALCLLGKMVYAGIGPLKQILHDRGYPDSQADLEISRLRLCVNETSYFENRHFGTCLLLAFTNSTQEIVKEDKEATSEKSRAAYKQRLREIFPEALAEKLYKHTLLTLVLSYDGSTNRFTELQTEHKRIIAKHMSFDTLPTRETRTAYHAPGTTTRFVPCPKCGHQKRCDGNTKRFICKNPKGCDFKADKFDLSARDPLNPTD